MATRPVLPPNEAPFDPAAVEQFLESLGPEMVLVGGQALAIYMDRYGIQDEGFAITNDGDALGTLIQAEKMAAALRVKVQVPPNTARTALVAQLPIPVAGGKHRNIDVLHQLFTVEGLKKSAQFTRRVIKDSVTFELPSGKRIRVMDPIDLLESRAQNAVGLVAEKGDHVVTQAAWAIQVASAALLAWAGDPASDARLGRRIQRVMRLARSKVGRSLLADHGLDVLNCISVEAIRPLAPLQETQLAQVAALQETRRALLADASAKQRRPSP